MIINIEKEITGKKNINIKLLDREDVFYNNINDILKIESIEIIENISITYKQLLQQLNIDSYDHIDLIIGSYKINEHLKNIKKKLIKLKNRDMSYYEFHYWQRLALTSLIENSLYDHAGTVTGRSRIIEGLNYLTMKKENRHNIKSVYTKGKIIEIDIVSLEPRILCNYNKMNSFDDVYKHTKNKLALNSLSRDMIKLGLLAIIYGAGQSTVKKLSGIDSDNMRKIKDYYKVDFLSNNLKNIYKEKGLIRNMYGRPIYSNNSLVNHFIQSSAADCAQLAFYQFLKNKNKNLFRLVAVIHDAIIIDAHPSIIDVFLNTYSISESHLGIKLPVKSEILSWKKENY